MKRITTFYLFFILLNHLNIFGQKTADSLAFLKWASTPPMGWNSWDCYGPNVTESEVKANADYMAKFLKKFGWEYIVVDIRWYVENDKAHGYNEKDAIYVMDDYGRFMPSTVKFPSSSNGKGFKPLADYIHSKGLKFGIHVMRGIPVYAVKKNTPILGSTAKAQDIYSTELQCPWLKDMYTIVAGRNGAQEYYNSIIELYASWGVDFLKIDDLSRPYHQKEIEMIRKAITRTGRKIVLSTSPGETPIKNAEHVKTHANMWRIIDDFWDNWPQLKEQFEICNRWSVHTGNGHFPDADMLPLGRIGIRAERGNNRMSNFTKDEQYTLMSLFAIFRSPLMFGGDLPSNDAFTLSLITDEDVIYINKNSRNGRQLFRENDLIAWIADDSKTDDKFLALFNAQDQAQFIESKAVWKSDLITRQSANSLIDIEVPIAGARKLYLCVSDGGDGNAWDHANWIEPKLVGASGNLDITSLNWIHASSGWGKATKNKSVSGKSITTNGVEYTDGIGTHSNSIIEYDLPEGYDKFTAKAGLDVAGIKSATGATVKFYVFTENPKGPEPADSTTISINLSQIGLQGKCTIKDVWTNKNLGTFEGTFAPYIRKHGAGLYRITLKK